MVSFAPVASVFPLKNQWAPEANVYGSIHSFVVRANGNRVRFECAREREKLFGFETACLPSRKLFSLFCIWMLRQRIAWKQDKKKSEGNSAIPCRKWNEFSEKCLLNKFMFGKRWAMCARSYLYKSICDMSWAARGGMRHERACATSMVYFRQICSRFFVSIFVVLTPKLEVARSIQWTAYLCTDSFLLCSAVNSVQLLVCRTRTCRLIWRKNENSLNLNCSCSLWPICDDLHGRDRERENEYPQFALFFPISSIPCGIVWHI